MYSNCQKIENNLVATFQLLLLFNSNVHCWPSAMIVNMLAFSIFIVSQLRTFG